MLNKKRAQKNMWWIRACVMSICLFSVCAGGRVYAGNALVSPRVIDLTVSPRDIIEEKLEVSNTSGGTLTLFAFVHNVTVGLEGGVEEYVAPSLSDRTASLSNWIEIQRSGLEVMSGSVREVPLILRIDPHAKPGTYHALISYSHGRTIDEAEALVQKGEAPSVLITVRIEAPSNDFMKLSHFMIKRFIFDPRMPETITYGVTNTGDTELRPFGDILLYNGKGEEVGSIPINQESRSIQPNESVSFSTQIPEGNFFGKYKALLTVRYGSGGAALYDTVFFYVFPWKKAALIFVILLVLALGFALWMHHRATAREDDESGDEDGVASLPVFVTEDRSASHHRDVIIKKT